MSSIPNSIIAVAQAQGVDPALALEVAWEESRMNPNVPDSSAGAIGIFQIEPATAADLGINPRDQSQNIQGGVRYLGQLLARFGDPAVALAAYDWGMGNVQRAIATYGNDGWFATAPAETRNYVSTILNNVQTQYSAVAAFTAAQGGAAAPGGSTSTLFIPPGLTAPVPGGFSWGGAALVMGAILGVGLALNEI